MDSFTFLWYIRCKFRKLMAFIECAVFLFGFEKTWTVGRGLQMGTKLRIVQQFKVVLWRIP